MEYETLYALSGDVHIAYQVLGAGPIDVVWTGSITHLELMWDQPEIARRMRRMARFARVILFDRRGVGLSDRIAGVPSLEARVEDMVAVLDAANSTRACVLGFSDGAPVGILFASEHPDRTESLILLDGAPSFDYVTAPVQALAGEIEGNWGRDVGLELWAPSMAGDDAFRQWWGRYQRVATSPGGALDLLRSAREADVRHLLPLIQQPTLVIHRAGDRVVDVEAGRMMAEQIPGARYVELPGEDHFPWGRDGDRVFDEMEEFLTGARSTPESDRVLLTVLFTDIVDSSRRATELGDARWRELLEQHNRVVRRILATYRGVEVDTAGDGFLATFDAPGRALRCALAIREALKDLGLQMRAGLHTGEAEVAPGSVRGIAVHIGSRVMAAARPGQILASSTVHDLTAGSGVTFGKGGMHDFKGIDGHWKLHTVESAG